MTTSNRIKAIATLAATIPALWVPASAGAATLFGSGSSAEQPILNALFKQYYEAQQEDPLRLLARRRQRGRQGRAGRPQRVRVNTRPPLPSDHRHHLHQAVPRRAVRRGQPGQQPQQPDHRQCEEHLPRPDDQLEPGSWFEPDRRRSTRSGATRRPGRTRSSSRPCSAADAGLQRRPGDVGRPGRDGRSARTPTRSATSGSRTPGSGSGVKPLTINGVACNQANIKSNTYPLWRWIWAVIPTPAARKQDVQRREVHQLGRDQQGRRARSSRRPEQCPHSTSRTSVGTGWTNKTSRRAPELEQDQRAELWLGALVCVVVGAAAGDARASSSREAWPSFAHNGLSWFGPGGNVDNQLQAISNSGQLLDQAPSTPSTPGR